MGLLLPYHPPTIFTIPPTIFTIPLTTFTIPFIIASSVDFLLSACSVPPAGRDLPSGTPEPWPPSQGRLLRKAAVQSCTLYVFVSGVGLGLLPASGEVGASILCPADLRLQGFCGCQESPPHLLDCTMSLPWCLRVLLVHRPLSLLFAMHPEEHTIPGWEPAWSRGLCTKTTEPNLILQPP